jgi:hypothetical protein
LQIAEQFAILPVPTGPEETHMSARTCREAFSGTHFFQIARYSAA